MLTWISVLEDKDGFGIKMPEKQRLVSQSLICIFLSSVALEGPAAGLAMHS